MAAPKPKAVPKATVRNVKAPKFGGSAGSAISTGRNSRKVGVGRYAK